MFIVSITVNAKIDKKITKIYKKAVISRAHEDLFFDSQNLDIVFTFKAIGKQFVRIDRLLDVAQIRKIVAEKMGKFNLQLLKKYLCVDERCSNNNNKYDKA